jgi:acyl carrier protein
LLAGTPGPEARERLTAMIVEQIGAILRMNPADIDPDRRLADIGIDSLLGLEIQLSLEQKLQIQLPLTALGAAKSVSDVVKYLMSKRTASIDEPANVTAAMSEQLLSRHGGRSEIDAELEEAATEVEARRSALTRFA